MINGLHVFFCQKQSLELDLCKEIIVRRHRWVNSPVLEEFVHPTHHQLPHPFRATSCESSTITQQRWNMRPRVHPCVSETSVSYLPCVWWDTPAASSEWMYSIYRTRPESSQTSPWVIWAGPIMQRHCVFGTPVMLAEWKCFFCLCNLTIQWFRAWSLNSNLASVYLNWRREWQPTPVFLPGESHGQRSLVGYSLWDRKELDTTKRLTDTHTHTYLSTSVSSSYKMQINVLTLSRVIRLFNLITCY